MFDTDALLKTLFAELNARSFVLPWTMCVMSGNGNTLVMRYHASDSADDVEARLLAESTEFDGSLLMGPITLVTVDRDGRTVICRVVSDDRVVMAEMESEFAGSQQGDAGH